jgi:hypothetical protein
MHKPVSTHPSHHIYDVFLVEDTLYVICPLHSTISISLKYKDKSVKPQVFKCKQRMFTLYSFIVEHSKKYEIIVNANSYSVAPSIFCHQENKIIFSTMVKNEDDYIVAWIDYHANLGVDHFIIYDNAGIEDNASWCSDSKTSNLTEVLADHINRGLVTLISWPYPKRSQGIVSGQACAMHHALLNFKKAAYIGYFDIDEYLNPRKHTNIKDLLTDIKKMGGCNFKFKNRLFHNPDNLDTTNKNFFNIFTCDLIDKEKRGKMIINPSCTHSVGLHTVLSGSDCWEVDERVAYFNHYYFLNKSYRGKNNCNFIDKSILNHII